jgi:hypothetical protein
MAQRTVVELPPPPSPPVPAPAPAPVALPASAPASGVVMVRPVHVNGAGPSVMAMEASVGWVTSRYCCSALREPLTEKVGGATWPVTSPTATAWPWMTLRELRMPAEGASTSSNVTTGLGCVTTGLPRGSFVSTGSGTVSTLMS